MTSHALRAHDGGAPRLQPTRQRDEIAGGKKVLALEAVLDAGATVGGCGDGMQSPVTARQSCQKYVFGWSRRRLQRSQHRTPASLPRLEDLRCAAIETRGPRK